MPGTTPETRPAPRRGPFVLLALVSGGLQAALFCVSVFGLWQFTRNLDNDFARAAREEFVGFGLWMNLRLLPLYFLVAAAGVALLYPAARAASDRGFRGWRLGVAAFAALVVLHLLAATRFYQEYPQFLDGPVGVAYKGARVRTPDWLREAGTAGRISVFFLLCAAAALAAYARFGVRALRRQASERRRQWVRLGAAAGATALVLGFGVRALSALRTAGPGPASGARRPNVLILASDSLRADHLGLNGYGRPTSPRLDAWARNAVNFRAAFVPAASTLESWLSFLTGQYPHTHGIQQMFPGRDEMARVAQAAPLLSVRLRRAGYRTAAMGDWCASIFNLADLGFDEVEASDWQNFTAAVADATVRAHFSLPWFYQNAAGHRLYPALRVSAKYTSPEEMVRRMTGRLEEYARDGRPFFLVGFLSCTHLPYHCYGRYHDLFCDPAYDGPLHYGLEFPIDKFIQGKHEANLSPRDVRQVIDLYDGCVRQFDDCAGDVLDALDRLGLAGNTIVAITSDHGDDLFEPGVTIGHGVTFLGGDQENRVPLVVKVPGAAAHEVSHVVRSIDLAPTLLDLAGLEVPGATEGVSLRPYLAGADAAAADLGLVAHGETTYLLFQRRAPGIEPVVLPPLDRMVRIDPTYDYNLVLRDEARAWVQKTKERAIRTDRWKLVVIPTRTGEAVRLFDVVKDPNNQEDLAGRGLPVEAELRRRLKRWEEEHREERWRE